MRCKIRMKICMATTVGSSWGRFYTGCVGVGGAAAVSTSKNAKNAPNHEGGPPAVRGSKEDTSSAGASSSSAFPGLSSYSQQQKFDSAEVDPVAPEVDVLHGMKIIRSPSALPEGSRGILTRPPPSHRPPALAAHDYSTSAFSPPATAEEWERLQMLRGYQEY
ncbi:unnamed protein product [Amoebophrya sp. A120]|nr:unnamed protein product [Amoebophrya sp. A120]|eukprot:GSA120T00008700001.1